MFSQKLSIITLLVKMVISDSVDHFALLKRQYSYNVNLSNFLKELLLGKLCTYRLFFLQLLTLATLFKTSFPLNT